MDMQDDLAVLVDLWCDIERDAGKEGATVMVGDWVLVVPVVVVLVVMLVTKNSSVPTLSTAFWLFSVAIRGLDNTCRLP